MVLNKDFISLVFQLIANLKLSFVNNISCQVESRNMYFGDNREKILTDKRAVELWDIAKNSGKFSQKELESIKVRNFSFSFKNLILNYFDNGFITHNLYVSSCSLVFILLFH